MTERNSRAVHESPAASPAEGSAAWWRPRNWNLRRTLILSVVLHVLGLITATVVAMPNFDPPERRDLIQVRILSELATPRIPVREPRPAPPKPKPKVKETIPDPLEKIPPKPEPPKPEPEPPKPDPPKPKPKPVEEPPVKKPTVKPPDPEPEPVSDVKIGQVDAPKDLPPIQTDRPTLGEDMQIELEGPPFEFDYYIRQMRRKISRNWQPPGAAGPSAPKMSALVRFRVQRDGRVADAEILESSNWFVFDQAVLRSLDQASPLSPLPKKYLHPQLGVRLRFVLRD